MSTSFSALLRLQHDGRPTAMSTDATPGFRGGKKHARKAVASLQGRLAELQEQLFANGRTGDRRRVLLVLQGMDTSGKGGVIDHVAGLVSPQGLTIHSFKSPTPKERAHDFLWRVRQALPVAGQIGVFDRSHYEDVLIVRVHDLVDRSTWSSRYDSIANFEADVAEDGVTIIKCFLHISPAEQQERLLARLEDQTKYWKYNPTDVDERGFWSEYAAAYDDALSRTNTDQTPWFVIPADHKWYRNLSISHLLLEHLEQMALEWPKADFDLATERHRLERPANGTPTKAGRTKVTTKKAEAKKAEAKEAKSANGKSANGKSANGKSANGKSKSRKSESPTAKPAKARSAEPTTETSTTRHASAGGTAAHGAVPSGRDGSGEPSQAAADSSTTTPSTPAKAVKTAKTGAAASTRRSTGTSAEETRSPAKGVAAGSGAAKSPARKTATTAKSGAARSGVPRSGADTSASIRSTNPRTQTSTPKRSARVAKTRRASGQI